ncbi:MAG: hypothetical protein D6813_16110 [Calditrichaeota bacterium]|nr:MAG: hypothetical protein D6813_16110 [Calditrichota bacterium]
MSKQTIFSILFTVCIAFTALGQEKPQSRFSHRGLKLVLGAGSFEAAPDQNLNEGEGGMLGLGWGFTDHFSLWINVLGAEHTRKTSEILTDFAGLELNLQHKFITESRLQPYGKVGIGGYSLQAQNSDTAFTGIGVNLALGMDLFFSRHFGVGAELMIKSLDYSYKSFNDGKITEKLSPETDGDTVGFMVTFTIQ